MKFSFTVWIDLAAMVYTDQTKKQEYCVCAQMSAVDVY